MCNNHIKYLYKCFLSFRNQPHTGTNRWIYYSSQKGHMESDIGLWAKTKQMHVKVEWGLEEKFEWKTFLSWRRTNGTNVQ
jgi:hypothetical protein